MYGIKTSKDYRIIDNLVILKKKKKKKKKKTRTKNKKKKKQQQKHVFVYFNKLVIVIHTLNSNLFLIST